MTTTISSACPKCGTIAKSGKISCCGRGGSWFGNCGSNGNAKLDHTWYEGIQACKTLSQSTTAIGRQSNAAQQRNSSNGPGMAKSKAVITPANAFLSTSTNTSTSILVRTPCIIPVGVSMNMFLSKSTHMSIVLGISVVFLLLIALAATGSCFSHKTVTSQKGLPAT